MAHEHSPPFQQFLDVLNGGLPKELKEVCGCLISSSGHDNTRHGQRQGIIALHCAGAASCLLAPFPQPHSSDLDGHRKTFHGSALHAAKLLVLKGLEQYMW